MTDVAVDPEAEAPAEETPREPCLCGCGQTPQRKRSRFMPGHDAQLKSRLYRVIRDEEATDEQKAEAAATLDRFEWPQPAPKRVRSKAKDGAEDDSNAPAVEALDPDA